MGWSPGSGSTWTSRNTLAGRLLTNSRYGVCDEPGAIDVSLPIAARAYQPRERELPCLPRYDQLTPGQRRIYLEWLASGRRAAPPELGYAFLFIYGLERRALVEQTDRRLVFDEVPRLRCVYSDQQSFSRSFDSYTSAFLWFLVARHPEIFELERVGRLMSSTDISTQDRMAVALGWFAVTATPLLDWAAFLVAGNLNHSQRSVVVSRVNEEFRQLFVKRYYEKFPGGLLLKLRTQHLTFSHKPASAVLPVAQVKTYLPNMRPLNALSEIWNDCIDELRKLSTVRAKQAAATLTTAAYSVSVSRTSGVPSRRRLASRPVQHRAFAGTCQLPAVDCESIKGRRGPAVDRPDRGTAACLRRSIRSTADLRRGRIAGL